MNWTGVFWVVLGLVVFRYWRYLYVCMYQSVYSVLDLDFPRSFKEKKTSQQFVGWVEMKRVSISLRLDVWVWMWSSIFSKKGEAEMSQAKRLEFEVNIRWKYNLQKLHDDCIVGLSEPRVIRATKPEFCVIAMMNDATTHLPFLFPSPSTIKGLPLNHCIAICARRGALRRRVWR
ncbi:hypothetical protein VTI74DRAFT_10079 [Chaetomium olivicolor]